jgi:catechol 2,3-dioxygenase-like lactoylglutathione lyase family enzyme
MAARPPRLCALPGLAGRPQLAPRRHVPVIEQSPALTAAEHDRLRPGLNHLAFHAGSRQHVDELAADGPAHGWTLLFPDRHPYAGGPGHYAAYLVSAEGFEVELVAGEP